MFNKKIILILVMLTSLVLVGCVKSFPESEQVKKDLIEEEFELEFDDNSDKKILLNDKTLKEFEIKKEKELNDEKRKLDVEAVLVKDSLEIELELELKYEYDSDDKKWEIDDIDQEELEYELVSGVNEEAIKKAIIGESINVLGDRWYDIEESDIEKVEIVEQKSDLEDLSDEVIFNVTLKNELLKVTSKMECSFYYEDFNWIGNYIESLDDYSYEYLGDYKLAKEQVKKDLVGEEFRYNNKGWYGEYWTIEENELKKIEQESEIAEDEGNRREVIYNVELEGIKEKISGKLEVIYDFDDDSKKWNLYDVKRANSDAFEVEYLSLTSEAIKSDLVDKEFVYNTKNNSRWIIKESEIKKFDIIEEVEESENEETEGTEAEDPESEEPKDNDNENEKIITCNIKLTEGTNEIEGDLKIFYKLGDDGWQIDKLEVVNDFIEKEI